MGDKRKKDIKDTIVSFLFFAVVFGVVWSLYYFLSRDDSAGNYKYCTLEQGEMDDWVGCSYGKTDDI